MGGLFPHPSLIVLGSDHIAVQVGEELEGIHSNKDGSRVGLEGEKKGSDSAWFVSRFEFRFMITFMLSFDVEVIMKVVVV